MTRGNDTPPDETKPHLDSSTEQDEASELSSIGPQIVYEAVRQEGEEELERPAPALFWSGLAAGMSMGFSMAAMGLLMAALPDAPWRHLVASFGYSLGFLIVVLGRQQLFTENTLTVVLPLLLEKNRETLVKVLRLWGVVLTSNVLGALVFAWLAARTSLFHETTRNAFYLLGQEVLAPSFGLVVLKGIFAGWLIALMVWLLPAAERTRVHVIVIITWLVALAKFSHIVAGSVDTLYLIFAGGASWYAFWTRFFIPTLLGNIAGGVTLVAALSHAQVLAGRHRMALAESGK